MGWWPGAREVILWILLQHGMEVTTDRKIMIEGSIRVVPDASGYHCRYIHIGNSLSSYHASFHKPYSESDGVFWSCRARAATAPLCLQAMFRIRLFSGLPEHGQRQPLHARAAANSQEHSAATAQLPGQDRQQQQSLRASHRLQASRPQISARSAPHD